ISHGRTMANITGSEEWKALGAHHATMSKKQMRDLFKEDSRRFEKFHLTFNDILLDFSKNIITDETVQLLLNLAKHADVKGMAEKMFTGAKINVTENRAVL